MQISAKVEDGFSSNGFTLVPAFLSDSDCAELIAATEKLQLKKTGSRNLLNLPRISSLAEQMRRSPLMSTFLSNDLVAVQCTYFEKSAERNWLVPVHQDLSIPVAAHVEHPALRGWSKKENLTYVLAPMDVLDNMIIVRLHLDRCAETDGPLRVISGSHKLGRIDTADVADIKRNGMEVVCLADQGTALIMKPLLLHASSKSTGDCKRRVLHFVFAPVNLPFGLEWAKH